MLLSKLYLNFLCLYFSRVKSMALIRFSQKSLSICYSFKHNVSTLDTFNLVVFCSFMLQCLGVNFFLFSLFEIHCTFSF